MTSDGLRLAARIPVGARRSNVWLHQPTVWRAATLAAACSVVAVMFARVTGPALVQATGQGGARFTVAVLGVLARVAAGWLAGRPARRRGARPGWLVLNVGLGGLAGFVLFPGTLSVLGLLVVGAGPQPYLRLFGAAVLGAAACAAGALVARPAPRPDAGRRPPAKPGVAG